MGCGVLFFGDYLILWVEGLWCGLKKYGGWCFGGLWFVSCVFVDSIV